MVICLDFLDLWPRPESWGRGLRSHSLGPPGETRSAEVSAGVTGPGRTNAHEDAQDLRAAAGAGVGGPCVTVDVGRAEVGEWEAFRRTLRSIGWSLRFTRFYYWAVLWYVLLLPGFLALST